ncbi:hypothetical protein NPIL_398961 [Nephila pilipes]|uniref:Uncharacterized protein n=1 Tax=Nephila pilipes TaxID=299642 RepID=A0A8X6R8A8_NEPPI|nr:hypothetical protein NPIL_398961 [Nephila pilipes]
MLLSFKREREKFSREETKIIYSSLNKHPCLFMKIWKLNGGRAPPARDERRYEISNFDPSVLEDNLMSDVISEVIEDHYQDKNDTVLNQDGFCGLEMKNPLN